MRKWISVLAVLVVVGSAYVAWPFASLAQLGRAVHAADADAVLQRIDVRAVRRSVINQVLDEGTRGTKLDEKYGRFGRSIAVGFAQTVLDERYAGILDDDAVRALIRDGRMPDGFGADSQLQGASAGAGDLRFASLPANPFRFLQGWRFRSLVTFEATIGEEGKKADWTTFRMRRVGLGWTLVGVRLPDSIVDRIKPAIHERLVQVGL